MNRRRNLGHAAGGRRKIYITNKKGLSYWPPAKKPKLLANVPLGSSSYGTPVAANGTLFIASQHNLWAVQKGAIFQQPVASAGDADQKTAKQ